jgi:CRISPR-associated endonuclease Csn1
VDALVIALSNEAAIRQLSAAAAAGDGRIPGRVSSRTLQAPWADFVESLKPAIDGLIVSHRADHKLSGPLHKETNYSREHQHEGKSYVHVRTPVHRLTAKDIGSGHVIVDPSVGRAVQEKLAEVGGDPAKLETNYPLLKTRTGQRIPIRRVRIRVVKPVSRIALPPRERFVETEDNHHVWFAARVDGRDREVEWTGDVVSRLKATQRKRARADVVEKNIGVEGGDSLRFKFALMRGDMVEMNDWGDGKRRLFTVNGFSAFSSGSVVVSLSRHNDARIQSEMQKSRDFRRLSPDTLRKLGCRKVMVDALGRVRSASG